MSRNIVALGVRVILTIGETKPSQILSHGRFKHWWTAHDDQISVRGWINEVLDYAVAFYKSNREVSGSKSHKTEQE